MKDKYPVQTGQGCCGDQPGAGMSRRHIPERSPSPSTLRVFSHHLIFESSTSFFFSPSCSALAMSQLSGLGGGGWPEPLRLSLHLDPATSWVWCMSRWPLPSTCSGCALVGVGVGQEKSGPCHPKPAQHAPLPNPSYKLGVLEERPPESSTPLGLGSAAAFLRVDCAERSLTFSLSQPVMPFVHALPFHLPPSPRCFPHHHLGWVRGLCQDLVPSPQLLPLRPIGVLRSPRCLRTPSPKRSEGKSLSHQGRRWRALWSPGPRRH